MVSSHAANCNDGYKQAARQNVTGPLTISIVLTTLWAGALFDGNESHGRSCVVIDNGQIVEIRPNTTGLAGRDDIDLGADVCLLPGLVDCHAHLCFDASEDPIAAITTISDDQLLADIRERTRRMLNAGITTVRDLGDRNYITLRFRDDIADTPEIAPELVLAGPPITTPGGHCYFLGGETAGIPALRAAVAERAERGCDVIKVMASGGNMTEGSGPARAQYTEAELAAVVDEAHRLGLPVAAHAHAAAAIRNAVDAGVDGLEHVTFMTEDGAHVDPELLATIAARRIFVDPTLSSSVRIEDVPLDKFPPELRRRAPLILAAFRQLGQAGVVVAAGSDCGITPAKQHDVFPYTAGELVERMGMTPEAALRSMTSVAAAACGLAKRKGRIAVGADADLLAVHGNPVADPRRLHDVAAVFRAGVRVR